MWPVRTSFICENCGENRLLHVPQVKSQVGFTPCSEPSSLVTLESEAVCSIYKKVLLQITAFIAPFPVFDPL